MDLEKYDFESALEQGFKSLFAADGIELRVADDLGEGELPDECLTLEVNPGGPISDDHLNSEGIYDHYSGTFEVAIKSNRMVGDKVSTSSAIRSRHNQLVCRARKALEEVSASDLSSNWGDIVPLRITPSGTERENDNLSKVTTLSYELQFRIA